MFPDTCIFIFSGGYFFRTGPNLRHFNDTVQNTSTVGFENLLQMCDTATHTQSAHQEVGKSTRQQGPETARCSKHARRFIIPFKNTRVCSHPLTCGLAAWRRWDTRSSLHLNGAAHKNHLIRNSLTALKLMKSTSWTFIQPLIDNVKNRGGFIFINTHRRLLNATSYRMSNLIWACWKIDAAADLTLNAKK